LFFPIEKPLDGFTRAKWLFTSLPVGAGQSIERSVYEKDGSLVGSRGFCHGRGVRAEFFRAKLFRAKFR
jgi:hypothetical protein